MGGRRIRCQLVSSLVRGSRLPLDRAAGLAGWTFAERERAATRE